jgi:tetratricopeptide (TPR) repeat protein
MSTSKKSTSSTTPNNQQQPITTTKPIILPSHFKQILSKGQKMLDRKDYKIALKNFEQILKKYPTHGETLTLKGVVLMNQADGDENKKNESLAMIKQGLKFDESCLASWKWYGQMLKYMKKYDEAIPCFEHYVKLEKDVDLRFAYLRDIAALQFQCRLYKAHLETRQKLAYSPEFKKNIDIGFLGMMIGNHMLKNYKDALQILDDYRPKFQLRFLSDPEIKVETGLYRAMLITESGEKDKAIQFLTTFFPTGPIEEMNKQSSDGKALPVCMSRPALVRERIAEVNLRGENFDHAKTEFYSLLIENTENLDFHRGYQVSILISPHYYHY